MKSLSYQPVPCVALPLPEATAQGVTVAVLREDVNHPFVSGNKWWKLKHNLEAAQRQHHHTLLTFGGPYSNHIYATAAAARELGLASIGIIRGERVLNPTLQFAQACGMRLHFISRAQYREKDQPELLSTFAHQFGDCYVVPEGGTNTLAVQGCATWGAQLWQHYQPDIIFLPVGTGGTMAGLACGLAGRAQIHGVSVLKGPDLLTAAVTQWVQRYTTNTYNNWHIHTAYAHGGYGKTTPELLALMARIKNDFALPLDRVYTAKMFSAVVDLLQRGTFPRGSRILLVHTGGLQGNGHYVS